MRRLVIALVVLAGLLVVADFGAAAIFEHEVSKRARSHFGLADDPDVRVGGFSFLAQAISGEYDKVAVDAKGVPVRNTLRDVEVHADLMGVHAPLSDLLSGSLKSVTLREVKGQVLVKASDVNRAISEQENELVKTITRLTIDPVSEQVAITEPPEGAEPPDPADEPEDTTAGVRMCVTADITDQSTDFCVFGIISLADGKISFEPKRLDIRNGLISGSLAPTLQEKVLALFAITLDPGVLPFSVTPTAVKVDPGVLSVSGKASNVVLSGGNG
ncbi:MAG TPA: DUF2993 domain-containing protein [Actinophytocola sp.]|uniref:LmeA family phospholipid-binding protein n=1 Tax=Actinophytocola sp. TaxID=1872138 RepID=UPI002DDDB5D6|nr:DUF2993 domain-containing protein [Actinophytocola sp.]HEV2781380.1 DUF2993 domain-containing protein [Actinophytocola sp.]